MSLLDILPQAQSLNRADKARLIQVLAEELAQTDAHDIIDPNQSYFVRMPDESFEAAEILLASLAKAQVV